MPAAPSSPGRFAGATVLVVEDHDDSRDALRLILESHGIPVIRIKALSP